MFVLNRRIISQVLFFLLWAVFRNSYMIVSQIKYLFGRSAMFTDINVTKICTIRFHSAKLRSHDYVQMFLGSS